MKSIYLTEDPFVALQMEQIIWLSDHNIFPVGLLGANSSVVLLLTVLFLVCLCLSNLLFPVRNMRTFDEIYLVGLFASSIGELLEDCPVQSSDSDSSSSDPIMNRSDVPTHDEPKQARVHSASWEKLRSAWDKVSHLLAEKVL